MNLQARGPSVLEQARAGIEVEWRLEPRGAHIRLSAGLHHETAADAVVLLARQHLQRGIMRSEAHAVGMAGQHLIRVEQKIERLVECNLVPAQ